jgi:hypothetical protein
MTAENTQSKTTEELGLSFKDTRDRLLKLLAEKAAVLKIMYPEGQMEEIKGLSGKDILHKKLADLERQIMEVFDSYILHLFESVELDTKELNMESKKLTKLTCWLIVLTSILTVSTVILVIRTFMGK